MKKKKGFALLETIIVVNIIILLISLFAKQNFINIKKSKYYIIKDDILTLNYSEEELIKEVEINMSSNKELVKEIQKNGIYEELDLKFPYSKDKNLWIEIKNKEIFLIHKKDLNKKYRKLDLELISENENESVRLRPDRYLTTYTNK